MPKLIFGERVCRLCHCTETKACQGGCAWISKDFDVCTTCAFDKIADLTPEERKVAVLVLFGVDTTPAPPDQQEIRWR